MSLARGTPQAIAIPLINQFPLHEPIFHTVVILVKYSDKLLTAKKRIGAPTEYDPKKISKMLELFADGALKAEIAADVFGVHLETLINCA